MHLNYEFINWDLPEKISRNLESYLSKYNLLLKNKTAIIEKDFRDYVIFYEKPFLSGYTQDFYVLVSDYINHDDLLFDYYLKPGFGEEDFFTMLRVIKNKSEKKEVKSKRQIQNKKMSAIGYLISGIIHEVFSPLNSISGRIQFLEYMIKDDPNVRKTVNVSMAQIKRITEILRLIQEFARERKNQKLSETILNNLVEEILVLASKFVKNFEIEIIFDSNNEMEETIKVESNLIRMLLLDFFLKSCFVYKTKKITIKTWPSRIELETEKGPLTPKAESFDFFLKKYEIDKINSELGCLYEINENNDTVNCNIEVKAGE